MPRHGFKVHKNVVLKEFCSRTSFIRENKALKTLQPHPFITELINSYHSETKNGKFVGILSLKYYRGCDLHTWITINDNGSNITFVRYVFKKILLAYDYAEKHSIFHRDIKPENVMIDENGIVKLIDWELCSFQQYSTKRVGTFEYMAPEVDSHNTYKCNKADIWSIGVVMFCLACGKRPYTSLEIISSDNDIIYEDVSLLNIYHEKWKEYWDDYEYYSDFPELPAQFKSCIQRLLQKDPEKRPTINELMIHSFFMGDEIETSTIVTHLKNNKKTLRTIF